MQIVILGIGKAGFQIAQTLMKENHHVVLIEKSRDRAMRVQTRLDCKVLVDEGSSRSVLEEADVKNADYFIATTDSDEINFITCAMAKKISNNKIRCIGRIRKSEHLQHDDLNDIFNLDFVVQPEREAALSIIKSIEYGGGVSDVFIFKDFNKMVMRNFIVPPDSLLVGQKLKDIIDVMKVPPDFAGRFLVALINRKDQGVVPSGEFILEEKDELFIIGLKNILDSLYTHLGKKSQEAKDIKKIIIIGATEVAVQLIDCYLNTQRNKLASILGKRRFVTRDITIVDADRKKCEALAEQFNDITILHADVREEGVLEEIEIASANMVISATESQERNIVLAAHSQNLGVAHTVALVEARTYIEIAKELQIELAINIRDEVTKAIANYFRGKQSLFTIIDGQYDIFRCEVKNNSKGAYVKIADIEISEQSIIMCINSKRHGTIIATGGTIPEPGDTLLGVAPLKFVEKIREIFEGPEESK